MAIGIAHSIKSAKVSFGKPLLSPSLIARKSANAKPEPIIRPYQWTCMGPKAKAMGSSGCIVEFIPFLL
jgi:hypothetical protein